MKINEEISSARSASAAADHLKPEMTESFMRLLALSNQEEEIKTRIDQFLFGNGVLTDDPALVEPLVEQFDSVWRGAFCRDCGRRDFCGDPVV